MFKESGSEPLPRFNMFCADTLTEKIKVIIEKNNFMSELYAI
jgi:hypothetical protein